MTNKINTIAKRGTDARYKVIKGLIKSGQLQSFYTIFQDKYINLSIVAENAGIPKSTLSRKKSNVEMFNLYELEGLATAFDMDFYSFTDFLRGIKKK